MEKNIEKEDDMIVVYNLMQGAPKTKLSAWFQAISFSVIAVCMEGLWCGMFTFGMQSLLAGINDIATSLLAVMCGLLASFSWPIMFWPGIKEDFALARDFGKKTETCQYTRTGFD
ncbi:hypothetical protein ACFLZC_00085 [Patescibacteria group bacterium]